MDIPRNMCFHLRRIGKPATKPNVQNIFKLNNTITKFGRHSGNDNFIDSAELDCFISRWHAEIHRILHKGQMHYVLKDKSLNGTYVNNHRVQGNHVLQPGEIICFGHTNGKNLNPGDYAPQTDSEFEFLFEEESADTDVEIINDDDHCQSPQPVHSTTDMNGQSRLSERATLGHYDAKLTHTSPSVESSHTVGTTSTEPGQDRISPVLQDISNRSSPNMPSGLVPLEQIASQASLARSTASCNITVQVAQDKVFPPSVQAIDTTTTSSSSSSPTTTTREQDNRARTPQNPVLSDSNQESTMPSTQVSSTITQPASDDKRKKRKSGPGKKRMKGSNTSKRQRPTSSDEEDGTWHYDTDKCDAYDCSRPVGDKVSWVQCDDCDAWYHVQCAGCNYDKVKQQTEEFHCGCV